MTGGYENNPGQEPQQPSQPGPFSQDIHHTPVAARVPEEISRGAFCDAVLILQTHDVFVLDFLSTTAPPQQIGARVVLTVGTYADFINALRTNVGMYERNLGPLKPRLPPTATAEHPAGTPTDAAVGTHGEPAAHGEAPTAQAQAGAGAAGPAHPEAGRSHEAPKSPTPVSHPRAEELYEQLKVTDKMLAGSYANVVMIRHTPEEFCLDFVANFYPRAVVTARVFMSAGRVPSLLETMSSSLEGFRQKFGWPPRPQGPGQ